MNRHTKYISKPLYYFSLLTWFFNVCFVVLLFFLDVSGLWFMVFFASVAIQGFSSGASSDKTLVPQMPKPYKLIDYCLIASKYLSFGLAAIGFISLLIGGGGPKIIDGTYCLVSHGDIVRYISARWFVYFSVCEILLFSCGILYFSTNMSLRVRAIYCTQNSTAE